MGSIWVVEHKAKVGKKWFPDTDNAPFAYKRDAVKEVQALNKNDAWYEYRVREYVPREE
jgi:ABC-type proline/glycine betaine transport system substrate-binding protein